MSETKISETAAQHAIESAQRITIKIGSSLLVENGNATLRRAWLETLASDIHALAMEGRDVIIVSSGAIALGWGPLGYLERPRQLDALQASAAAGQMYLAEAYTTALQPYGYCVAQLLITLGDFEDRARYLNARATCEALLRRGAVPIFNENDTVATQEIRFGDNDRLAARVAGMMGADLLLLLSDVDGLYDKDPNIHEDAQHIPHIAALTEEHRLRAGPAKNGGPGSGGMITKLAAARMASDGGTATIIASGLADHPITAIRSGAKASCVNANGTPLDVRKRWLRGMMAPKGFFHLDAGAVDALQRGASLLPVGVFAVDGVFDRGDLVGLMDQHRKLIGQGLCAYASEEAVEMKGHSMEEAETIIGYGGRPALVHRDDLVIF